MKATEYVNAVFQRMEQKLQDILNKNLEKVEDPEKLKEAIEKALEVVRSKKEECLKVAEEGDVLKADECVKAVLDEAKQYLGKDMTGLKTAKATFSRCVNTYRRKLLKEMGVEVEK